MLQKFLFVGLGGSGGKTLRFLHEDLSRRLDAIRWDGGMPKAWQFLHIDVPVTADGVSPDLPAQLSRRSYVGLAPYGMSYMDLDEQLVRKGPEVLDYAAAWRPRADRVGIQPAIGAGQFRAVGRAITAASLHIIAEKLRQSVDTLKDNGIVAELSRLSLELTGDTDVSVTAPQIVLVSSIAGGSGAGSVLDVADVLRHTADPWGNDAVAFLYLPDVFADVPDAQRTGVSANALATISELMNAYWATGEADWEGEFPLLKASGVNPDAGAKRGPRYPFLVGRSNGDIRYATQNEVYKAVAKSLASWMTNKQVQDQMSTAVLGNWANTAELREDGTRLAAGPGRESPFSAMGFASVGLGRERFAQYSEQRLAGHAVDHLLRAHHTQDVRDDRMTPEEAAAQRASSVRHLFMERCGLKEVGPTDNQIIDAIRGGVGKAPRREHLQMMRGDLTQQVVGSGQFDADASLVLQNILARYREREPFIVGQIFEDDAGRARTWARDIQERVNEAVGHILGQEGARVTELVLSETINEIERVVVPELRHEAQSARGFAAQNDERVRGAFTGLSGKIKPSENPAVSAGINECIDSAYAQAEARLLDLAASLAGDFADNCLRPLVDAIAGARRSLEVEDQGTPENPSVTKAWSRGGVPRQLQPTENEILLEETDDYPAVFMSRVRATIGEPDEEGALSGAVRQVISGENPADPDVKPNVVRQPRHWVPGDPTLSISKPPTKATYSVDLRADQILRRAGDWVYATGTAMSAHVLESLKIYLSQDGIDPQTHASRLERFRVGLQQAVTASRPLIEIDPGREALVHGGASGHAEVVTPFPFPEGHPARQLVFNVLHNRPADQLSRVFDESDTSRIEITTFLAGQCQPPVIKSLYSPIKVDWTRRSGQPNQAGFWDRRRARPLTEFIPVPPDMLLEWVRGWHVARLLNWIEVKDLNRAPIRIWSSKGWRDFPCPLLGPSLQGNRAVLPAILESFPLTLLDEPEDSMPAYWQLQVLGARGYQHLEEDEEARSALENWIRTGVSLPGAPAIELEPKEDKPNARIDAVCERLASYEETYMGVADGKKPPNDPTLLRLWELRVPLLRAIDDPPERLTGPGLRQRVEALREYADGNDW